ncbi:MAG: hypothetical protein E6Q97_04380 [Desulfurellales bacterium]|nr:MAG: hypothetical protein E6Q97_04380 [Desulfurellales bacterium]
MTTPNVRMYYHASRQCGLTATRAFLVAKLVSRYYADTRGVHVARVCSAWVRGWSDRQVNVKLRELR